MRIINICLWFLVSHDPDKFHSDVPKNTASVTSRNRLNIIIFIFIIITPDYRLFRSWTLFQTRSETIRTHERILSHIIDNCVLLLHCCTLLTFSHHDPPLHLHQTQTVVLYKNVCIILHCNSCFHPYTLIFTTKLSNTSRHARLKPVVCMRSRDSRVVHILYVICAETLDHRYYEDTHLSSDCTHSWM